MLVTTLNINVTTSLMQINIYWGDQYILVAISSSIYTSGNIMVTTLNINVTTSLMQTNIHFKFKL